MACKRSAVRSRLAQHALRLASRRSHAMHRRAKRGARRSPKGEDGLADVCEILPLASAHAEDTMWYVYIIQSLDFPIRYTSAPPQI